MGCAKVGRGGEGREKGIPTVMTMEKYILGILVDDSIREFMILSRRVTGR